MWTSDVTQAYLQSVIPLARSFFLTSTVSKLDLDLHECIKILQPLYGLSDFGDHWYQTLQRHHIDDLGMKQMKSDSSLNSILRDKILSGMPGTNVDDLLRAGASTFQTRSSQTETRFDMKPCYSPPSEFSDFASNKTTKEPSNNPNDST